MYDQSKNTNSKHFCESCLHGYTTPKLLERHKPECMEQLKRSTRTELPKAGENKVKFKNHHKETKEPLVVYADFESLIWKIHESFLSYRGKDAVYRRLSRSVREN